MARLGMLNLYIASVFLFRICVYILLCACVHLCDRVRLSHTQVPYMHGRISSVSLHPLSCLRQHLCVSQKLATLAGQNAFGDAPVSTPISPQELQDNRHKLPQLVLEPRSSCWYRRHFPHWAISPVLILHTLDSTVRRISSLAPWTYISVSRNFPQLARMLMSLRKSFRMSKLSSSEPFFSPVPALWFLMGILLLNLFGHCNLSLLPHFAQWAVVILFAFPLQTVIMKNKMWVVL